MRFLFITHHRLSKSAWRTGSIGRRLAERGHEVVLIVTAETERWRFKVHREGGLTTVEAPDLTFGRIRSGWDPIAAVRRCLWLASCDEPFDVIHLFETRPATILPGWFARRKWQAPFVIDWVDWWGRGGLIEINRPRWYQILFGRLETFFEEHFRPWATGSTVICYGLRDRAIGLGVEPDSILHMRHGSDLRRYNPMDKAAARRRLDLPQNEFLIGYSSRDTFFDVSILFEGVKLFGQSCDDWSMVMTGLVPASLRAQLEEIGIGEKVILPGYVPAEQYADYLAACDVFAVPFPDTVYNRGRWPGKFSDYVACARPVVFNAVGDLGDFVGAESPGLACAYTPEGFAESFRRLYEDPKLGEALGANGREYAVRDLDWDILVDRLEVFYGQVLERWRSRSSANAAAGATTVRPD